MSFIIVSEPDITHNCDDTNYADVKLISTSGLATQSLPEFKSVHFSYSDFLELGRHFDIYENITKLHLKTKLRVHLHLKKGQNLLLVLLLLLFSFVLFSTCKSITVMHFSQNGAASVHFGIRARSYMITLTLYGKFCKWNYLRRKKPADLDTIVPSVAPGDRLESGAKRGWSCRSVL